MRRAAVSTYYETEEVRGGGEWSKMNEWYVYENERRVQGFGVLKPASVVIVA